ncbi:hypothetical protein [Micromonospora cathayae]|uniref:DUF4179 domain-containing protein n=1 Tax=Micromonospora cathayae TaxID=3028804 RepID=A0ABY7ZPR4_9ACTN|nr:hypothetical protein [Micromonospora sp. HUAS 3]WDZ84994.1 hypothetical protein PVK37_00495 [Micromonospora sp. HUAS 3]
MTDLDERITRVLREHADTPVDVARLTSGAVARGRQRRRRLTAVGVAALALVALLGPGVLPAGLPALRWPGAGPAAPTVAPPPVVGSSGASARPDLVGTDPTVLHFGVDSSRARYLGWRSGLGVESARLTLDGGRQAVFDLGRTPADVEESFHDGMIYDAAPVTGADFDGEVVRLPPAGPGGDPGWVRRWQPVPGLYARVLTVGPDDRALRQTVDAVRLDAVVRCATPLRLTALPAGATVAGCLVNAIGFPDALDTSVVVTRPGGGRLEIRLEHLRDFPGHRSRGNRTVDGRPALAGGGELRLLDVPGGHLTARFGAGYQGFTEDDAATVLAGVRLAPDLAEPSSW